MRSTCFDVGWWFHLSISIYGGLKFTIHAGWDSTYLQGDAYIGAQGGLFVAGPWIPGWNRRRRRRAHKCKCHRLNHKGQIPSCPRWATASFQVTFTLKIQPLQSGENSWLKGFISFKFSLKLFGINVKLPKIADIPLFNIRIGKIVGNNPAPTPRPRPKYKPWGYKPKFRYR